MRKLFDFWLRIDRLNDTLGDRREIIQTCEHKIELKYIEPCGGFFLFQITWLKTTQKGFFETLKKTIYLNVFWERLIEKTAAFYVADNS